MGIEQIAIGLIIGASFWAGTKTGGKRKGTTLTPTEPPTPPSEAEATPEQKERIRRKTRTILTGPLTGEEEFGTPPPTLLGTGDPTKKKTVG